MAAVVRLHEQVITSLRSTILKEPRAVFNSPSESSSPVILGWLVGPSASYFSSRDPRPSCSVLSCILVDPRFRDVAVQQRGDKGDVAKSEARALLPLLPGGLTVVGVAVRGEFTLENQALIREPIAEFRRIFHDVALARRPFIVTWTNDSIGTGRIPSRISLVAGIELRRGDVAAADWWGQDITESTWKDEERERIGLESEGDEEDGRKEGRRDDKQREESEADVAWELKSEEEGENADVEVEVVEGQGGKGDGAASAASGASGASGATGGEGNRLEEEFWAAHCPLVCDVAATLPLFTHDKQSDRLNSPLPSSFEPTVPPLFHSCVSSRPSSLFLMLSLPLRHPLHLASHATSFQYPRFLPLVLPFPPPPLLPALPYPLPNLPPSPPPPPPPLPFLSPHPLHIHTSPALSSSISASLSAIQADVISPHALWLLHPPQPPSAATSAAASSASGASAAAGAVRPILIGSLPNGRASGAIGSVTRGREGGGTAEGMLASTIRVSLLLNQSPPATSASAGQNGASVGLSYTPAAPSIHLHQISLSLSTLVFAPQQLSLRAAVRRLVVPGLLRQVKAIEWMVGDRGDGRQEGEGGRRGEEEGKPGKGAGATSTDWIGAAGEAAGGAAKEAASAVSFQLGLKFGAYHFLLPSCPHPLTVIYPLTYGEGQQSLVDMRMTLHHRLGLPLDRPMLRIASSLSLSAPPAAPDANQASSKGLRLWDVHVGLPRLPHSAGCRQYLVQGSYEYYHYMQDRIDDSGWGCAYRSLQTIVSWFRIQQYTSQPVPTHRRIQQALVEIGDKEAAFVGSSQWIGAIELSFILDHLLGVTCKVLTVSSGADMPSKGRQLAHHFSTQGTPVMIGGGVLSYTLLGVDYDEATGECAFLILDPHYTGGEDLKAIRSGGWVAWRKAKTDGGADFFVRDAFYNLLLPQRPATV
ncbi:unnamed protein product [Closterium sp. Naga37s-1]|nr:unnamed protein product [Closterium sp. Naga37s-1]